MLKDVDTLWKVVASDKQIMALLANQIWEVSSKKEAIAQIAKKMKLTDETRSWLDVLAENGRLVHLPAVLEEFKHIYYRRHNVEEVEVETVKSLSVAQDKKLKTLLEKKFGKEVLIHYTIKPELLGGLVVKYGSSMADDSVSGKLNRLEIIMKGGQ